ncbi:1-(5-phosphoribosyl)-5-[(5-phosphoribosylamino)methylideneamino]imidazole-4-carboxamide isomerase [Frateuria defendens]|uniref:1-(5-phosphoribosyl)-5-[(5- phosphoribosylamino)methylideneamino]imidazole-4- carboxamide isomerase n=1 Tax=Frateuria defendens TaxID=2219559 RepID=UPI00066FBD31|nr:1-(5-phosphoribosyl)-5-[(5-phosphoribosylamino)methylideneamino]imidazole-4-carboxamide isomerase [Frateuria defendens]
MTFQVIPAIDLRGGRVVRLKQGDYAQQTTYGADPREQAARYAAAGAQWLHLVDLDGARSGNLDNLAVIEAIAGGGMQIQAGGGVRAEDDLRRLYDAGVCRVVLGSVAIREPERVAGWLAEYGSERLTIALDTRRLDGRWTLPSAGWTETESRTLDELAPWYAARGARHLLCTDIERDGMLAGFNLDLYRHLAETVPQLAVQASGGVRSLEDIRAAREAGARGVILGRALLEGRFTIEEALGAPLVAQAGRAGTVCPQDHEK